jgi:hypothetical protein
MEVSVKRRRAEETEGVSKIGKYIKDANNLCIQAECEDDTQIASTKYKKAIVCYKEALVLKPSNKWITKKIQDVEAELRLIKVAKSIDKAEAPSAIYVHLASSSDSEEAENVILKPQIKKSKHVAQEKSKAVNTLELEGFDDITVVRKAEKVKLEVRTKIPKKVHLTKVNEKLKISGPDLGEEVVGPYDYEEAVGPSALYNENYRWIEFLEGLMLGEYVKMIGADQEGM